MSSHPTANRNHPKPASAPTLKAVELFAGIGGFRLACDAHGFETIWANDHDERACRVYRSRFAPDVLRQGDIRALTSSVPDHDLLTAGFPCQPFSSAGKKTGIRDPRGTLFQAIVDVIGTHGPSFFVLENVKRLLSMEDGSHFATILDALAALDYRIEWRLLNAMHFGLPQNRQRVVILGTHNRLVPPGAKERVFLATTEDLHTLSDIERATFLEGPRHWSAIESHAKRFPWWGLAADGRFFGTTFPTFPSALPIAPLRSVLQREDEVDPRFDFTDATRHRLKDNAPVNRFVQGVQILSNQDGGARMGYTIFGVDGVAPTLTAATSRHYERYWVGGRYRKLTNVEYARLQGFPDSHCSDISVYDQYALFGNAVPPPIIKWVFERMRSTGTSLPASKTRQLGLFYAS